jgi:hypothetical protein
MKPQQPLSSSMAIDLYQALMDARQLYLHPALNRAVYDVGVAVIDSELQQLVPGKALNQLARLGLRGERAFPVPSIIMHTPSLIGYYRMLLGFSRKEFGKQGYSTWVAAEKSNKLSRDHQKLLTQFCSTLITPLTVFVYAMNEFKDSDLSDLALLTLGPTLQGGRINVIGLKAEEDFFRILGDLVKPWIEFSSERLIRFTTPKGDTFELARKSDPDISLYSGTGTNSQPTIAMEIKGGSDASNAHNRAGEAEKSHLKAVTIGYPQRWTFIRMPQQRDRYKPDTPSSTEIFELSEVEEQSGPDWQNFKRRFFAIINMSEGEA